MNTTPAIHYPGGVRELLAVSIPLILSTGAFTLMQFCDRVFLSWYSQEALAASLPAGVASFLLISFFMGTAMYVSTFVSQYDGAGRPERIGAVMWQGNWFSLASTVILALLAFTAGPLFRFVGHDPSIQDEQITYFFILTLGAGGEVFNASLSSFWSGLRKTWTLVWVNSLGVALNIVLDYALIFGVWGFPELGIAGAALATVTGSWFRVLLYGVLLFQAPYRERYQILYLGRIDPELFGRLLRFGIPSGVQILVDVAAFTLFMFIVGRIGATELAATNIAITVNSMCFMPMIGLHIAVIVLVGNYQGAGQPDLAARSVWSAIKTVLVYMWVLAAGLALFPEFFVGFFEPPNDPAGFAPVAAIARNLIYFVAIYSLCDGLNLVFAGALKGAGDTKYVMWMLVLLATFVWVLPTWVVRQIWPHSIYAPWTCLTLYIFAMALAYALRYRTGKWKEIQVIEHGPLPQGWSDGPMIDVEMPVAPEEELP